jgi:HSP20 family molecular chaperone IbpA
MAGLPPLGTIPAQKPTGPKPAAARGESRLSDNQTSTAAAAAGQSEAARQIEQAQNLIRQSERDSEVQLSHVRAENDQELTSERVRNESAIESQRTRGYEELRELQRRQAAEVGRVKREGERELANTQNFYQDSIQKAEHEGARKSRETLTQEAIMNQTEDGAAQFAHRELRSQHASQLESLKATQEAQLGEATEAQAKYLETTRTNSLQARAKTDENYGRLFEDSVTTHQATLDRINAQASRELSTLRADTAQKLAAYSSRQNDPFYKMLDLQAELTEHEDHFQLTARIPEHERDHINVNLLGDRLVLTGARRNEEKLDLSEIAPGRSQSTSAYQSYSESFGLPWPVDARGLSKVYDGDHLVVTIPKKNEFSKAPMKAQGPPERYRAERPQFPGNLPVGPPTKGSKPLA